MKINEKKMRKDEEKIFLFQEMIKRFQWRRLKVGRLAGDGRVDLMMMIQYEEFCFSLKMYKKLCDLEVTMMSMSWCTFGPSSLPHISSNRSTYHENSIQKRKPHSKLLTFPKSPKIRQISNSSKQKENFIPKLSEA